MAGFADCAEQSAIFFMEKFMVTLREKVKMYEQLLHTIQMYREVTMDGDKVRQLLDNVGAWSYAHRQGNGELTDKQQQALIDAKFRKLTHVE
jgi:hypothetical protein